MWRSIYGLSELRVYNLTCNKILPRASLTPARYAPLCTLDNPDAGDGPSEYASYRVAYSRMRSSASPLSLRPPKFELENSKLRLSSDPHSILGTSGR